MIIQHFGLQPPTFCQNMGILFKTLHLAPWGAYECSPLRGNVNYCEKQLTQFNFSRTFVKIIQDFGIKLA